MKFHFRQIIRLKFCKRRKNILNLWKGRRPGKKVYFRRAAAHLTSVLNFYICSRAPMKYVQNDLMIMQRKFTLLVSLLFIGLSTCIAQSSSFGSATASGAAGAGLLELNNDNWAFYADEENQVYYIDFENLSVNLNDIVVRRQDGEILMQDDVFELPVNTIYEIDFSQYGAGNYDIELRSFTGVIRRPVSIR